MVDNGLTRVWHVMIGVFVCVYLFSGGILETGNGGRGGGEEVRERVGTSGGGDVRRGGDALKGR